MSLPKRLLAKFHGFRKRTQKPVGDRLNDLPVGALIQAHGDWLALLAVILEREKVITGSDLARALSEFAKITAEDRPEEGMILSFWASCLQDATVRLGDMPSLH